MAALDSSKTSKIGNKDNLGVTSDKYAGANTAFLADPAIEFVKSSADQLFSL